MPQGSNCLITFPFCTVSFENVTQLLRARGVAEILALSHACFTLIMSDYPSAVRHN
jgi:hypothetical protein